MHRFHIPLLWGLTLFFSSHAAPTKPQLTQSIVQWTSNFLVKTSSVRRLHTSEKIQNLPLNERQMGSQASGGLTLDPCSAGASCKRGRACLSFSVGSEGEPCVLPGDCTCLPPAVEQCETSSECGKGEVCSRVFGIPQPFCTSAAVEKTEDYVEEVSPSKPIGNPNGGLGMDYCSTNSDCRGGRICMYSGILGNFDPCKGREPCICLAENPACFNASECEDGEICAETPISIVAGCISTEASLNAPGVKEIPDAPQSQGMTLDSCETDDDCVGGRGCSYYNIPDFEVCVGLQPCVCLPAEDPICLDSSECEEGEVCADTNINSGRICLSKAAAERFDSIVEFNPAGTPEPVSPSGVPPISADEMAPENTLAAANEDNEKGPKITAEPSSSNGSSDLSEEPSIVPVPSTEENIPGGGKPSSDNGSDILPTPEDVSSPDPIETPPSQETPGDEAEEEDSLGPGKPGDEADVEDSPRPGKPSDEADVEDSPRPGKPSDEVEEEDSPGPGKPDDEAEVEDSPGPGKPGNMEDIEDSPAPSKPEKENDVKASSEPVVADTDADPKPEQSGNTSREPTDFTPMPSSEEEGFGGPAPANPRPDKPNGENGDSEDPNSDKPSGPNRPSQPSRPSPRPNAPDSSSSDESESEDVATEEPVVDGEETPGSEGGSTAVDTDEPASSGGGISEEDSQVSAVETEEAGVNESENSENNDDVDAVSTDEAAINEDESTGDEGESEAVNSTEPVVDDNEDSAGVGPGAPSEGESGSNAVGGEPSPEEAGATADDSDVDEEGSFAGAGDSTLPDAEPSSAPSETEAGDLEESALEATATAGFDDEEATGDAVFPESTEAGETSDDSDDVCIDAAALRHLGRNELVFGRDRWGRVVCDASGSCATRGHMVVYRGESMMMGTYCGMVGCEERMMLVNSPRFRRQLRVASETEGLEFLGMAARYGTRVEERAIAFAVRVGL